MFKKCFSLEENISYPVHRMKSKSSPRTFLMNCAADLTKDSGASHLQEYSRVQRDCQGRTLSASGNVVT